MNRKRIHDHYIPRIRDDESNYGVLDWESAEAQEMRFRALADHVDLDGCSLLDVGCGLGDLWTFLKQRGIRVDYQGIDILPEMVSAARSRNPEANIRQLDLFREPEGLGRDFDVVFCSGIFNLNLGNNREFLEDALTTFFGLAERMVVFNLLHKRSPDPDLHYFYFDPVEVREMLKPYTDDITIIDDYLPNDFTIIARCRSGNCR